MTASETSRRTFKICAEKRLTDYSRQLEVKLETQIDQESDEYVNNVDDCVLFRHGERNNLKKPSQTNWARIDQMTDEEIDTSDIPPLDDAFFTSARLRMPPNKIDGDEWLNDDDPLTDTEKSLLEARLAASEREPDAGSSWKEVEVRTQSRIKNVHTIHERTRNNAK